MGSHGMAERQAWAGDPRRFPEVIPRLTSEVLPIMNVPVSLGMTGTTTMALAGICLHCWRPTAGDGAWRAARVLTWTGTWLVLAVLIATGVHAQDLEPRLYANTPVGVNFLIAG